jgi:hypothetical protein
MGPAVDVDLVASNTDSVAPVDYVSFTDPDYLVAATALDHVASTPVQPVDDPVALFASCFADDPDSTDVDSVHFVSTDEPPLLNDPLASSPYQALHALNSHLRGLGTSHQSLYANLRVCAVGSTSSVLQHWHMDGGSMVCTTDRRRLLWYFQDLADCRVKLRVADNTPHTPQGFGYLRVPAGTLQGYIEVKCYWTPSMPATILSPYAIGTQNACRGYSICNHFDGNGCTVTFHHRLRQSQDISMALTLRHGLLFTDPFRQPTHAERLAPYPTPKLHAVPTIHAREGQFPIVSETREGIDGSVTEAMEGQDCCLRRCPSCARVPPVDDTLPCSNSAVSAVNVNESDCACPGDTCPCTMHAAYESHAPLDSDTYCLPCRNTLD